MSQMTPDQPNNISDITLGAEPVQEAPSAPEDNGVKIVSQVRTNAPIKQPTAPKVNEDPVIQEPVSGPIVNKSPLEITPDTEQVEFSDGAQTKETDAVKEYEELIKQYTEESEALENTNYEKQPLGLPLSSVENIEKFKMQYVFAKRGDLAKSLSDATDPYNIADVAQRNATSSFLLGLEAMRRLPKGTEMKPGVRGMHDADAVILKRYKDQEKVKLSGPEGLMTFTAITGGVRKLRLYNSGIYLSFRNIPINSLFQFFTEFQRTDYEYAKDFGGFYYLFADFYIRKYIIENLLTLTICGSNYNSWRDSDKLMSILSVQDFELILWHLAVMMHPSGIKIATVCSAEVDGKVCDNIETADCDLTKLRLDNNSLINDEMFEILKKPGWISDDDLFKYREVSKLNRPIEFEYRLGMGEGNVGMKRWKINLKQAMMKDWLEVGEDYVTELKRNCDPKKFREVTMYTIYNAFRAFKPWIESMELTVFDPSTNKDISFVIENDGSPDNNQTIFMLLDEFQANAPQFGQLVEEYILDTRISHVAYYYPKCTKCGTVPANSYKGFIPYDCMHNFFILARTKLVQEAALRANSTPILKSTQNSAK